MHGKKKKHLCSRQYLQALYYCLDSDYAIGPYNNIRQRIDIIMCGSTLTAIIQQYASSLASTCSNRQGDVRVALSTTSNLQCLLKQITWRTT